MVPYNDHRSGFAKLEHLRSLAAFLVDNRTDHCSEESDPSRDMKG